MNGSLAGGVLLKFGVVTIPVVELGGDVGEEVTRPRRFTDGQVIFVNGDEIHVTAEDPELALVRGVRVRANVVKTITYTG